MTFIASAPFQYDPNASGVKDIPYLSGVESSMAWMDSVVRRHNLSGPLVDSSGFKWRRYYSEENSERFIPQTAPPFCLDGFPMHVSGFWGQFNEKIAFLGRETGGDYDNRPFTNQANNVYWSGNYRNPLFAWATSGNNIKPLPQGMFEYGQIDKDDFNTYIKKRVGASFSIPTTYAVERTILGNGAVFHQSGLIQSVSMDSQSDFTEIVSSGIAADGAPVETHEHHIFRSWSWTEDINETFDTAMNTADEDTVFGSGTGWLSVSHNIKAGSNIIPPIKPYIKSRWFAQNFQSPNMILNWLSGTHPRQLSDLQEEYVGRSFNLINDAASAGQTSKFATFNSSPTEVIYSLPKLLALQGSGYDIFSNFSPDAFISPYSNPPGYGDYVLGYRMNNTQLNSSNCKPFLYDSGNYTVYNNEGNILNGTAFHTISDNADEMLLDPDTSNKYVQTLSKIERDRPCSTLPTGVFGGSWSSYIVEEINYKSGIETARQVIDFYTGPGGALGGNFITSPRFPNGGVIQTFSGLFSTVTRDVLIPTTTGDYVLSGVFKNTFGYQILQMNQGAQYSTYTPPSGEFTISVGPGLFIEVDPPLNIFDSNNNVGPYFSL